MYELTKYTRYVQVFQPMGVLYGKKVYNLFSTKYDFIRENKMGNGLRMG